MRRRHLLVALGAGLAGCTSDDTPATLNPTSSRSTTRGRDRTATQTTVARGEAQIVDTEIIRGESIFGEIPWVRVDVENAADVDHGQVGVQVRFYDETDALLATRRTVVEILPASTTWRYYQRFATDRRDQLDRVETGLLDPNPRPDITPPPGTQITESEIVADPDSGVTVTGVVDVGDYSGDLEVIALLYDSADQFRGTVRTVNTETRSGESWRFDVGSVGIRTPHEKPQVEEHDIIVNQF